MRFGEFAVSAVERKAEFASNSLVRRKRFPPRGLNLYKQGPADHRLFRNECQKAIDRRSYTVLPGWPGATSIENLIAKERAFPFVGGGEAVGYVREGVVKRLPARVGAFDHSLNGHLAVADFARYEERRSHQTLSWLGDAPSASSQDLFDLAGCDRSHQFAAQTWIGAGKRSHHRQDRPFF